MVKNCQYYLYHESIHKYKSRCIKRTIIHLNVSDFSTNIELYNKIFEEIFSDNIHIHTYLYIYKCVGICAFLHRHTCMCVYMFLVFMDSS